MNAQLQRRNISVRSPRPSRRIFIVIGEDSKTARDARLTSAILPRNRYKVMDPKEDNVEEVWPSEKQVQCVKGSEVLSNRDLVAYSRSVEKGGELPPQVDIHIQGCIVCGENWKFVKETDPVLRKLRKERVQLIIRTVVAQASPVLPPPGKILTPVEKSRAVPQMVAALSPRNAVVRLALDLASKLPSPLPHRYAISSQIVDLQDKVRAILDKEEREKTMESVCSAFEYAPPLSKFSTSVFDSMGKLGESGKKFEDLSQLLKGVPLDVATALFSSFPITFLNPGLLEERDNKICLNVQLFHQIQSKTALIGGWY